MKNYLSFPELYPPKPTLNELVKIHETNPKFNYKKVLEGWKQRRNEWWMNK